MMNINLELLSQNNLTTVFKARQTVRWNQITIPIIILHYTFILVFQGSETYLKRCLLFMDTSCIVEVSEIHTRQLTNLCQRGGGVAVAPHQTESHSALAAGPPMSLLQPNAHSSTHKYSQAGLHNVGDLGILRELCNAWSSDKYHFKISVLLFFFTVSISNHCIFSVLL